jgi:hypothetical protein
MRYIALVIPLLAVAVVVGQSVSDRNWRPASFRLYLPLNSSNPKNVHGPIWLSLDDSWRAATGKMFFGIFALSSLAVGASSAQTMFMDLSRTPDAREERETVEAAPVGG